MGPNRFVSVDHSEIVPATVCSDTAGQFVKHAPIEREWGRLCLQHFTMPHISLVYFEAQVNLDLHVREHSTVESPSINSCFCINGHVRSTFKGLSTPLTLTRGLQNFIYKPEVHDDHYIKKQEEPFKLLHLAIDREYFLNLLDEKEWWCADLRERIQAKELVYGAGKEMVITPRMNSILLDILHCPLSGPLRKLLIEAKVLELIAYQLDYYYNDVTSSLSVSACEKDCFYSLRDYLSENFNDDHSLQSLSRAFCLNEFKLKKGFKELFGDTVFGYIHSLRMQHARNLILDEKMNINMVAGRVGYKNANHFSTAFKKQFGIAPSLIK